MTETDNSTNASLRTWLPMATSDGDEEVSSQCYKYSNHSTNTSVPCGESGWTYLWPEGEISIVNEVEIYIFTYERVRIKRENCGNQDFKCLDNCL